MRRKKCLIFLVAIFCATCVAERVDAKKQTPPGQSVGTYRVWVSGYYSGQGTVVVQHNKVSIDIAVDSDDGEEVLSASNIQIKNNHFSGDATIGSKHVTVTGRFDIPDGSGVEVEAARVSCTLETDDGHKGRFTGYLDIVGP
jgi:hypothetical protein